MTCEECRWKTERGECPWNYEYEDTDYAEDCDDFRYIMFQETAFKAKDNTTGGEAMKWYNKPIKQPWLSIIWIIAIILLVIYGYELFRAI